MVPYVDLTLLPLLLPLLSLLSLLLLPLSSFLLLLLLLLLLPCYRSTTMRPSANAPRAGLLGTPGLPSPSRHLRVILHCCRSNFSSNV